jgi:hypothetical protein
MTKFSTLLRTVALLAAGVLVTTGITPVSQTPADATEESCADAHSGVVAPTADSDGVYIIDTVGKLVFLSENYMETSPGSNEWREESFLQTVEIDLEGCLWTPIGDFAFDNVFFGPPFDNGFIGTFDGGGEQILNLKVAAATSNFVGMFGSLSGGEIRDVHLVDPDVTGNNNVGALAGRAEGALIVDSSVSGEVRVEGASDIGALVAQIQTSEIIDSSVSGTVSVSGTGVRIGGMVGTMSSSRIEGSTVSGQLTIAGNNTVGGLVGSGSGSNSLILNSSVTGDVTFAGNRNQNVGGLAGNFSSGTIERSFVGSDVKVVANGNSVGGLVGFFGDSSIKRSFSAADVTGARLVGGLVGENTDDRAVIVASFATGDVIATGDASSFQGAGGLAGRFSGQFTDSYATGSVTAPSSNMDSANHGGLIGALSGSIALITTSYAIGSVGAAATANTVGGLVGSGPSGFTEAVSSFWNTQTSGQSDSLTGTPATTAQLTNIATFTSATPAWKIVDGWDEFDPDEDKVWGICPGLNDGYPFLLWEYTEEQVPVACGGTFVPTVERTDTPAGAATPVLASGALPTVTSGSGVWQQADGTTVPLSASSPGANQVRYSADGVTVTLTGAAGTSVSNGLVANPNGEIVCEVCTDLATGNVVEVWMFSTPRLVAAHRVTDGECQQFTIPVVAPLDGGGPVSAGAHTLQLALPTAQGMQAVNVGVTVGGPVPASVPAGEGPTVPAGLLALTLLAAAGVVVAARRQVVAG